MLNGEECRNLPVVQSLNFCNTDLLMSVRDRLSCFLSKKPTISKGVLLLPVPLLLAMSVWENIPVSGTTQFYEGT